MNVGLEAVATNEEAIHNKVNRKISITLIALEIIIESHQTIMKGIKKIIIISKTIIYLDSKIDNTKMRIDVRTVKDIKTHTTKEVHPLQKVGFNLAML